MEEKGFVYGVSTVSLTHELQLQPGLIMFTELCATSQLPSDCVYPCLVEMRPRKRNRDDGRRQRPLQSEREGASRRATPPSELLNSTQVNSTLQMWLTGCTTQVRLVL